MRKKCTAVYSLYSISFFRNSSIYIRRMTKIYVFTFVFFKFYIFHKPKLFSGPKHCFLFLFFQNFLQIKPCMYKYIFIPRNYQRTVFKPFHKPFYFFQKILFMPIFHILIFKIFRISKNRIFCFISNWIIIFQVLQKHILMISQNKL